NAQLMTTSQGGSFQNVSASSAINARKKSCNECIALVHTGLYSAASSRPTTPALTPARAACTRGLPLQLFQNGRAPAINRKEGKKTAINAIKPPYQPEENSCIEAPRKAAKVNKGPGTACAAP